MLGRWLPSMRHAGSLRREEGGGAGVSRCVALTEPVGSNCIFKSNAIGERHLMAQADEAPKSVKLLAGGVIPALANLVFNAFTKLISDNVHGQPFDLDPTTLDISVGCAFAIVGVWVSCRNQGTARILSLSVLLLVFLILGIGLYEIWMRQFSLVLVLVSDVVSIALLLIGIWRAA